MKKLFAHLGRVFLTLVLVTMAVLLGWHLWVIYMNAPWTRDGKSSSGGVRLTSDVSGFVSYVLVHDDQYLKQGAVILRSQQTRY